MSHRLVPNHITVSILPSCIEVLRLLGLGEQASRRAGEQASGAEIVIGRDGGVLVGVGEHWALGPLIDEQGP
jgi:hypothetical protein